MSAALEKDLASAGDVNVCWWKGGLLTTRVRHFDFWYANDGKIEAQFNWGCDLSVPGRDPAGCPVQRVNDNRDFVGISTFYATPVTATW